MMTYRFQVADGATFDGNYRVMVHFVDADGDLMWTDDHDPPIPTSQWKPGQTIEYTRTMFLPGVPVSGQGDDGGRPLQPVHPAAAAARRRRHRPGDLPVATLELEPQSEGIFVVYGDGWHASEVSPRELAR